MFGKLSAIFLAIAVAVAAAVTLTPGQADGPGAEAPASDAFRREHRIFHSAALGRDMTLTVCLPPGYDGSSERYPVLYMLHGLGGDRLEWHAYGLCEVAAEMIVAGEILPLLLVTPEGERSYWFNHADGGPRWGDYLARDVVSEVDANYRTLPQASKRAVGGLSMGADGALQVALKNPDVFGVVGVHSPVLRTYEQADTYYGSRAYFETQYPVTLVRAKPAVANSLAIQLDVGDADVWREQVLSFHDVLDELGIPHTWSLGSGDHSGLYWSANLRSYLMRYMLALAPRPDDP